MTIKNYWERKKPGRGQKAVVEWLFHVAIDNISTALKFARDAYDENAYNIALIGIKENGFIDVDFGRGSDREINRLFKEVRQ